MKKVLVIGSGGREHAIAHKFSKSNLVDQVFVAPGNPGMQDVATIIDIAQNDFDGLIKFAKDQNVDLVFVGPEIPLCDGIVDVMEKSGINVFGPNKYCAQLEGSKIFSKNKMRQFNVPTAEYATFTDATKAKEYLKDKKMPIVIKADGLAAGKGVLIVETLGEALKAIDDLMIDLMFDESSSKIVIEEFLEGEEFSLFALVNGKTIYPFAIAQDHKRAYDNDLGLNTGGMGAYTPVNHIPQSSIDEAIENIVKPMVYGLNDEQTPFKGLLYAGCMLTDDGVKTIEYNVRFGDPETEVLLLALENDLYEAIDNCINNVEDYQLSFDNNSYVGVVMASTGYPETSFKGAVIENLSAVDVPVFHMGTKLVDNNLVTNGGRVLFVVAKADNIKDAQTKVYGEISKIKCDDLFYRSDIANKALNK